MAINTGFLRSSRRQISLLALLGAVMAALIWFGFLEAMVARQALLPDDPGDRRMLINGLCRTSTQLISAVFACLFLAVPLTASIYTPQLIRSFARSRTNQIILGFYVFSAVHAVWTTSLPVEDRRHDFQMGLCLITVMLSLVILLPYLFSVFRLLNPLTIVARVHDEVVAAMQPASRGLVRRRESLAIRIRNLGNIALRMLDRNDRDVALAAVEALGASAKRYLELKSKHDEAWFKIEPAHFPGLAALAINEVNARRTWVEMEFLRQFSRVYDAALAKVPDVISAIGRSQRQLAIAAAERGHEGALDISLRFFNNYLREAIKRRDVHAVFDLLFQYRLLGEGLFETHPQLAGRIANHLLHYGRMARAQVPFATDLVAYDLGRMVTDAARREGPAEALIEPWLELDAGRDDDGRRRFSAGMLKARVLVEARLRAAGRDELAERVAETMRFAARPGVAEIRDDLGSDSPELFWEVTDRQENLDHAEAEARPHLDAILARLEEEETA